MLRPIFIFLFTSLFAVSYINSTIVDVKAITIKGELSCGSAMCNIGDEYDIFFPIKGIDLFDYCKDGDDCEIEAVVNGKTIIEISAARKIGANPVAENNINVKNADNQSTENSKSLGLYGINLETDLQEALNAAIERGCHQVFLYRYAENAQEIEKIKEKLTSQGVDTTVLTITDEVGPPSIPAAVIHESYYERIVYGYSHSEWQFIKDKYNIIIIPIRILLNNRIRIEAYFYKKVNDTHYLPLVFLVALDRETMDAAVNFLKEKFTDLDEIDLPDSNMLYFAGDVYCLANNNQYLSFTTYQNMRKFIDMYKAYEDYRNLQRQKDREIEEQKRIQEKQKRNKALQEGM